MTSRTTRLDRRTFVRRAVVGAAVSGYAACAIRGARAEAADDGDGYFDVHVHLTQRWYGQERGPVTAEAMVRWMDGHDVSQAAVLPLVSPEAFWYPVSTDFVIREAARFPDRLVPFCAIDPRTAGTHLPAKADLVGMLKRYQDAGARGFGEHKPKLPIDDPLSMKLYEACSEVRLPVLFHLDNAANMDRPGLPGLEKVLTAFPELPLIGHGKGWWASIAGGLRQEDLHVGYPRGPVAAGGAIDRLMSKYPNLYGDLSSSGAHALLRDHEFGQKFLERRADRLLFGTDYYDLTQKEFTQFDLFDEFTIAADQRAAIARGNARQLLFGA